MRGLPRRCPLDEGFVYIVDRAKDMIIRGGEDVYCVEVEAALFEHPAVTDAAVIGIPHHVLGEEVGAVVHLTPGTIANREQELHRLGRRPTRHVQGPGQDLVPRGAAPRNANGKTMKRELKAELVGNGRRHCTLSLSRLCATGARCDTDAVLLFPAVRSSL